MHGGCRLGGGHAHPVQQGRPRQQLPWALLHPVVGPHVHAAGAPRLTLRHLMLDCSSANCLGCAAVFLLWHASKQTRFNAEPLSCPAAVRRTARSTRAQTLTRACGAGGLGQGLCGADDDRGGACHGASNVHTVRPGLYSLRRRAAHQACARSSSCSVNQSAPCLCLLLPAVVLAHGVPPLLVCQDLA